MPLPKVVQQRLIQEVRFVADKMTDEQNVYKKLYYLSAIHGEIGRVLNWSWNRDLVLIHGVFQHAHQALSARLRAMPDERATTFPAVIFERLTRAAQDLADLLEKPMERDSLCELLARVSELEYATTGNGSYLIEKGILKL